MTKEIELTQGQVALVDDEDYEELNQYNWCAHWSEDTKSYYAIRNTSKTEGKKTIRMHRFIMNVTEKSIEVDHKNGNTLDNRKQNLRLVTSRENSQNMHMKKTSIYPGVCYDKRANKWKSYIRINGKRLHIGYFINECKAFDAYLQMCEKNGISTKLMTDKFGKEGDEKNE